MWNRFWMLLSTIWLGFCVYAFITTREVIPPIEVDPSQVSTMADPGDTYQIETEGGHKYVAHVKNGHVIDYAAPAEEARQDGKQARAAHGTANLSDIAGPAAQPLSIVKSEPLRAAYKYDPAWLWLASAGYVLWLMGRFVRYGFRMRPTSAKQ